MSQMYPDSNPQTVRFNKRDVSKTSSQRYPVTNDNPKTAAPKKQKDTGSVYKPSGTKMKAQPASTSRLM